MRLAVTGSRGQLASSLLELAQARGTEVVTLHRPEFDLADARSVAQTIDRLEADVLVNAAAYTAVDRAEADVDTAFAVNAEGAGLVARACAHRDLPIIHVSTDYVFDGTKTSPYVETDALAPLNVYGRSKCEGERQVASAYAEHIILRTAWVHSPFGTNFVRTMLRLAKERDEISVVNDQCGSPTYAPHLAEAIMSIAQQISAKPASVGWGVYHCANAGEASWYDVAVAAFQASRDLGGPFATVRGIPSSAYQVTAQRPMNSRLDSTKLAGAFNVRLPDWRQRGYSRGRTLAGGGSRMKGYLLPSQPSQLKPWRLLTPSACCRGLDWRPKRGEARYRILKQPPWPRVDESPSRANVRRPRDHKRRRATSRAASECSSSRNQGQTSTGRIPARRQRR